MMYSKLHLHVALSVTSIKSSVHQMFCLQNLFLQHLNILQDCESATQVLTTEAGVSLERSQFEIVLCLG